MAVGLTALGVALLVVLYVPPAPVGDTAPSTSAASCDPTDTLCRAVELLEELRDRRPRMTAAEQEVVDALADEVAEVIQAPAPPTTGAPAPVQPPPPPSTTTTSTTTTTTTRPRPTPPPVDADGLLDAILSDLLDTGEDGSG